MATSNRRIPPNRPEDWLYKRIEDLELKVKQIDNRSYPTVPIYKYGALPDDPIEGQIAIIADAPDPPPDDLLDVLFDTHPQTGTWLEISTTGINPATTQGIYLFATVGSGSSPGVLIGSDGIVELSSNHVILGTDSEIDITTTIVTLQGNQANYPREIRMQLANNTLATQGSKFVIYGADGTPILEVRDDNTFHLPSGASWATDL
jgi:hypothetical protein